MELIAFGAALLVLAIAVVVGWQRVPVLWRRSEPPPPTPSDPDPPLDDDVESGVRPA